jgi:hypothetical protein
MFKFVSALPIVALALLVGCRQQEPTAAEKRAIAAAIEQEVRTAYDLKSPNVEKSFERLYPDTGRIISASGGRIVMSRDTLFAGIHAFWTYVGSNMRNPTWIWDQFNVDVISRDAAVMTAAYHVPHLTPTNMPHVIGGAWTAVFRRQNGRWVIVNEHLSDLPPVAMEMKMKPHTGR